jgi:hypothetical protein
MKEAGNLQNNCQWESLVNLPDLESGERWFESSLADQFIRKKWILAFV